MLSREGQGAGGRMAYPADATLIKEGFAWKDAKANCQEKAKEVGQDQATQS